MRVEGGYRQCPECYRGFYLIRTLVAHMKHVHGEGGGGKVLSLRHK